MNPSAEMGLSVRIEVNMHLADSGPLKHDFGILARGRRRGEERRGEGRGGEGREGGREGGRERGGEGI
jgi:hypothetical protein